MKKEESKPAITRLKRKEIEQRVLEFLQKEIRKSFNYKQIAFGIGATHKANRMDVINVLDELVDADKITEVSLGKYKAKPSRTSDGIGFFIRRSTGKNSVVIDEQTYTVAERNSMHALNGDKVRAVISTGRRSTEPEARVVEILERKDQTFIGTIKIEDNRAILVTDSKFLANDIEIPRGKLRGGKDGDKAVVRITGWRDSNLNPTGEVVDVLGRKGDNTAEMHAILAEFGLPYKYPESVEALAAKITPGITPEEVRRREDFRDVITFTIDPRDAKDFDDAISLRRLPNGNMEVGVHIADVTHYVLAGSPIDKEAQQRATSVYLVDRTIPMLPEHLSNGICSLRPDEEKLTFSAIFELDSEARVVAHRIGRTVIRSDRRFTYEEAQERIETGKGDYASELQTLDRLAAKLRAERFRNGALEFDRVEVRFEIDDKGRPTEVFFKESKAANKLVEEFMLLANRAVATAVGVASDTKKKRTFVYRVHESPDTEKLANLSMIAARFGFKVKTEGSRKEINSSINRMLRDVKGRGEENLLSILAIRSMAKAVYTIDNVGHYGLGFDYYTHFTSPIRRYPDMMVHRLLARYMSGGRSADAVRTEDLCRHSSDMEQTASGAERASIKYKQVEYMQERLGEVYDGVISGVTEWGLYVELTENLCEGLVPVRDLTDDFYDFDEKNYRIVGRRTGVKYTLGDRVKVQVARADLEKKQLDFALISDSGNPNKPLPPVAPSKPHKRGAGRGRGKSRR